MKMKAYQTVFDGKEGDRMSVLSEMREEKNRVIRATLESKIVAIFRGIDPARCSDAANALYEGGIRLCEVTFNAAEKEEGYRSTLMGIRNMIQGKGDRALFVGAGTVLTTAQVSMAHEAGASFIVTPSTDPEVIRTANELGMVTMPGAFTPTEIVTAYEAGADFVKIFPAGNLGTSYAKAIRGPLAHIPMLAVGGVSESNAREFLEAGFAGLGIGGNLLDKTLISEGRFDELTALARKYVESIS